MLIVLLISALLIAYWILEFIAIFRYRQKIQYRILVTGSRGKSSVTRLIAAGLREAGIPTLAKVTGSDARIINPDGSETGIKRLGLATILEQKKILQTAARSNVKALVIESMALRPQLMKTESLSMIRPHITALCKIAPDHLDITAKDKKGLLHSFSDAVPVKTKVVLHPDNSVLAEQAEKLLYFTTVIQANTEIEIDMDQFCYIEHASNVHLALQVCRDLGIDEKTALQGMFKTKPDPGALQLTSISRYGQPINILEAFAANDPESILAIKERFIDLFNGPVIVLLNTRVDRPHRSEQLLSLLLTKTINTEHCILTGNGQTTVLAARLEKEKVPYSLVKTPDNLDNVLRKIVTQPVTLFCIGNVQGAIAEWTKNM